jgi:hypothetical protein
MSLEGELASVDVSRVLELLEDPVMGTFRVFGVADTRPIYQEGSVALVEGSFRRGCRDEALPIPLSGPVQGVGVRRLPVPR